MSLRLPIYLDNAATSHPKPETVYLAVDRVLRLGGSAGRGTHQLGLAADRVLFAVRESLAVLFGVKASERFVFGQNATQALNQALFGLLQPGDRVVTTSMEHNAVVRPLRALAGQGVEVVKVAADALTGSVARTDLQAACTLAPTRLLVINHASNAFGTLQDLDGLGAWCREQGIVLLVDGSQSAGCVSVNLPGQHIDLFAAPGHKGLLGPQGTGFLYVREGLSLRPFIYGGTGADSRSEMQPEVLPEGLESGTLNIPGLAGLSAALDFVLEQGIERLRFRKDELTRRLLTGLATMDGVTVYGPPLEVPRMPVVSFNIDGIDPSFVGYQLDQEQIIVRTGLHCSADSHKSMGTFPVGTVRVSPGCFTTEEEIDRLLELVGLIRKNNVTAPADMSSL